MTQEQLREKIIEKSFYLTQAVINGGTIDEVHKLRLELGTLIDLYLIKK